MRYSRVVRIFAVVAAAVAITALAASTGRAQALTYNCSDIYYTTATNYGANESIVVDVFNEGRTIPDGVQIGDYGWSGPTNVNYYSDHTSTTWTQIDQAQGTYNIWVDLGVMACRDPHGTFQIK